MMPRFRGLRSSDGMQLIRSPRLVLAFILFFPLVAALLYFLILAGTSFARPTYMIAKTIQFGFPLIYLHIWKRKAITVRAPNSSALLLGLVSGLCISTVILIAYFFYYRSLEWMAEAGRRIWDKLQEIGVTHRLSFVGLAFFLSIVHALLEEYYWRWFICNELKTRWPSWLAILITNMAFTLHHIVVLYVYIPAPYFWTSGVLFTLSITIGGIIWSWLYNYTGSIYSPWLSHALVDGVLMYIGYDLCRNYWP